MEPTYVYLLLTFLLFFTYFIIISLFGILFSIIFNADYLNKKLTLKRLLKNFAIGLSFHLIYGMIIISLRIFNFFTLYLPFIICDISLLIYIYYKKSNTIKDYFRDFKKGDVKLFIVKKGPYFLIFFIVIFMLYIIQMFFINKDLPYAGNDQYLWFNNIWFVHKYGYLDYDVIKSYPPGFVIFCSSIISVINDYTFFFYFFKYLPFFFSIINLLVLFVLSKEIFKKKIYIFFTLAMYLGFTFIFTRNNKALPSLLATTLGFLFLLFLGKDSSRDIDLRISSIKVFLISNIKNKNIFLKGLLFTGIFLAHPLYGLFFMIFYFLYECFLIILNITKTKFLSPNSKLLLVKDLPHEIKVYTTKYSILIRNFVITQVSIILIFIILISPYVIGTSLNRGALVFGSYFSYISDFKKIQSQSINLSSLGPAFRVFGDWLLFGTFYYYINLFFGFIFANTQVLVFYKETIQIGLFLIVLGIFLNFNKYHKLNEKQNNLINFFKFTFILTFLMFIFSEIFILKYYIPFISNAIDIFYEIYRLRLFELFSGFWAVIFVLTFNYITVVIKKKFLKTKSNQIPIKRISQLSKISLIFLIIFTSGFFYFTNFRKINYPINYNEDQLQGVLFIGNYFEENPLEDKKGILLEELISNAIYGLIVDVNLEKNYFNFTGDPSYSKFNNEFNLLNNEFVFLNISKLNDNFKSNFSTNFDTIYEGINGYIFSKVK